MAYRTNNRTLDRTSYEPDEPQVEDLSRPYPSVDDTDPLVILSDEDFTDQAFADPTFPEDALPKRLPARTYPTQHKLTVQQQRLLAAWIVDGYTFAQANEAAVEQGMPAISKQMWAYYKTRRLDLLEEATAYLSALYLRSGLGTRALRVKALVDHARELKGLIDDRRMLEADVHVIGFGKGAKTVTAQKFNATLSKSYVDTILAIDKVAAPIEATITANARRRGLVELDDDTRDRFKSAIVTDLATDPVVAALGSGED